MSRNADAAGASKPLPERPAKAGMAKEMSFGLGLEGGAAVVTGAGVLDVVVVPDGTGKVVAEVRGTVGGTVVTATGAVLAGTVLAGTVLAGTVLAGTVRDVTGTVGVVVGTGPGPASVVDGATVGFVGNDVVVLSPTGTEDVVVGPRPDGPGTVVGAGTVVVGRAVVTGAVVAGPVVGATVVVGSVVAVVAGNVVVVGKVVGAVTVVEVLGTGPPSRRGPEVGGGAGPPIKKTGSASKGIVTSPALVVVPMVAALVPVNS
jgi:hypothetical protein